MPLEILLGLVVAGIAGIALLTMALGLAARRSLSQESARAEWLRHFPDDAVQSVWVAQDGHSALILTEAGPGLLWPMGADTVGRRLIDFDMIDTPTGLDITFHDFTAPRARLRLGEDERLVWKSLMVPQ